MAILPQPLSLALETRKSQQITNWFLRTSPIAGSYQDQIDEAKKRPNAKRRNVGPSHTYNCHGLTFGARRSDITWSVASILKQDDYVLVAKEDVMPGDVVIYYGVNDQGMKAEINHSGIVLERSDLGSIRVLSKWGHGDEWVHFLPDCPYNATYAEFYRINDCPPLKRR
jgi:hypothetical protein